MRDRFTRVLKGHIALATARFPKGTTGSQLDALARAPLWDAGLDYDHGTGHGVGSYLVGARGPAADLQGRRTAWRCEPGMIVSNEPGYYKTGDYGIRIENLVRGRRPPTLAGGERPMLRLRDADAGADRPARWSTPSCSTPAEIAWLDAYHARVREVIAPKVDARDRGVARRGHPSAGAVRLGSPRRPGSPRAPGAAAPPARAQ